MFQTDIVAMLPEVLKLLLCLTKNIYGTWTNDSHNYKVFIDICFQVWEKNLEYTSLKKKIIIKIIKVKRWEWNYILSFSTLYILKLF